LKKILKTHAPHGKWKEAQKKIIFGYIEKFTGARLEELIEVFGRLIICTDKKQGMTLYNIDDRAGHPNNGLSVSLYLSRENPKDKRHKIKAKLYFIPQTKRIYDFVITKNKDAITKYQSKLINED